MSYSLSVVNGDLALKGSNLDVVSGIDKLKQDLQLWMAERYGGDRFHPDMGSILQEYIGSVIGPNTQGDIQSEAYRVLDNYQRVQYVGFRDNPTLYSMGELLAEIIDVSTRVNYDSVRVDVSVRSMAREDTTISVTQGT